MLKRLNDALPGLVWGILVYGVFVGAIGVWFVADKLMYLTGLAIGIVLACGMVIHMAVVIRDVVEIYEESQAQRIATAKSAVRYLAVAVVFFVIIKWKLGNPLATFVGVMGLKVSAYLQPLAHRLMSKLRGRGGMSSHGEDTK